MTDDELKELPSSLNNEAIPSEGNVMPLVSPAMANPVNDHAAEAEPSGAVISDGLDIIDSVFGGLSIEDVRRTRTDQAPVEVVDGPPTLARYFRGMSEPSPRINPCLMIRGNSLFVYGGVVEVGDVEVALDDCWALDLNKRDRWRQLLPGTMHALVWQGEDDATEGTGEYSF